MRLKVGRRRSAVAVRLTAAVLVSGVLLAAMFSPGVVLAATAADAIGTGPDPAVAQLAGRSLTRTSTPFVTRVLDRDGGTIALLYDQYRVPVGYAQIAPAMTAAIVAIEDRRFFTNAGFDVHAMLRALLHDATGGNLQGASTITQQYIKNYRINVVDRSDPAAQQADRADTLGRKLRDTQAAVLVAARTSKPDVLAGYLNLLEFSGNVYGVAAAAHAYFDTTPDRLTVPQAALLAGMVNNPSLYDPYAHRDRALARRNVVIDAMARDGSLRPTEAATAKAAPLGLAPDGPLLPGASCLAAAPDAGFFCDYAVSYLQQHGLSADQLTTGGYTVTTTMDPTAAAAVKQAVDADVPPTQPGVADAFALLAPGRSSHQVLAMVGNRSLGNDAAKGQVATNIVAAPSNVFGGGSTFKIFTTAAALEAGVIGFDSRLPDPYHDCFAPPVTNRYTSCYPVANDGPGYPDPISLQQALATSPNVPFVGLETKVGLPAVVQMAQRLGLRHTLAANELGAAPVTDPADPRSRDPRYAQPQSQYFGGLLSFTLGVSPVSPLEMANVVATLKSGGVWCPPDPVLSVTDRFGAPVPLTGLLPCQQVVAPGLADTLQAGLSQDTRLGTSAAAARAAGWQHADLGKTGTTEQSESAVFVGGVDGYAAASMVFADGAHPAELCPGPPVHLGSCGNGAFGGTVAAPSYFTALNTLLAGRPDQPVPPPDPAYLLPDPHGPTVPYAVGMSAAAARNALGGAGYPVSEHPLPGAGPARRVVAQSPQGSVPAGTPVQLWLGGAGPLSAPSAAGARP